MIKVLSFDCYETLVDWERGILKSLNRVLSYHNIHLGKKGMLELYAEFEKKLQQEKFKPYRIILQEIVLMFSEKFDFFLEKDENNFLVNSMGSWKFFPDVKVSLGTLKEKYRLAIFSNTDNDLLLEKVKELPFRFDWLITSQQTESYKPMTGFFDFALSVLSKAGIRKNELLHCGSSIYHNITPAKNLGIKTAWINRKSAIGIAESNLTPDLEVPDLKTLCDSLATFHEV